MKTLRVPLYKQTETTCGPTSARMVLAHHGIDVSLSGVVRATVCSKITGTTIAGVANVLGKYGLSPELILWLQDFPPRFFGIDDITEIEKWARRDTASNRDRRTLAEHILYGGVVTPRPVQIEDLRNAVADKCPPIINFDVRCLYDYKLRNAWGHYAVVIGVDKNEVALNDPYFGKVRHDREKLLYACHSWTSAGAVLARP